MSNKAASVSNKSAEGPTMGRRRGARPKLDEAGQRALVRTYNESKHTAKEVARMFGICRSTLHSIVARFKSEEAPFSDKSGGDDTSAEGGAAQLSVAHSDGGAK